MRSRRRGAESVEFWWKGRAIAMCRATHVGAISNNNYTSSGKVSL